MHIWQPEPGETLLARTPVTFATGAAMRVRGMRWFRDPERRDIQGELTGWPDGPVYRPYTLKNAAGRTLLRGTLIAAVVIVWGVLSSQGGSVGGSSSDAGSDKPDDRADEVDDFPVMWAAPGTIARSLPWQLDPGRRKKKRYTTHAIVTDRRLVIVGLPAHKDRMIIEDEVLWETPRSTVSTIQPRNFKFGQDVEITFTDGSWCRLEARRRSVFTRYLHGRLDLLPLNSLTEAQQRTVQDFAAAQPLDAPSPHVVRNACGCYRIAVVAPSTIDSFFGASNMNTVMNSDGTELDLMQYHPEDDPD